MFFDYVLLCWFICKEVVLPAQGDGIRTEVKRPWLVWENMQRWGFPCDLVLFSLAVNFCRLKVNIFSVRRHQDKVTAVLFNHPRVLICMEHAAGSCRSSMCQWFCCNSYCENPVNWGKFLMTKASSGRSVPQRCSPVINKTSFSGCFFHANEGD